MSEALKRTILVTVEYRIDGEVPQQAIDDAIEQAVHSNFHGVIEGDDFELMVKSIATEVVPTAYAEPAAAIAAQRLKD